MPCVQPNLKTPKTRKKLQEKFHGPFAVVRFTNPAAVILRKLATGPTLKKSVNISWLKVGYVRAEVNDWDPLDVDSDEEVPDEDDLPPSSFTPRDEDAPNQSIQDDQAPTNPPNNTQQNQQQPPQPVQDVKATTSAQDTYEAYPILKLHCFFKNSLLYGTKKVYIDKTEHGYALTRMLT